MPLRSNEWANATSRSNLVLLCTCSGTSSDERCCPSRGSCDGPPESCSSKYSGPRMESLTSKSSLFIVRVSV